MLFLALSVASTDLSAQHVGPGGATSFALDISAIAGNWSGGEFRDRGMMGGRYGASIRRGAGDWAAFAEVTVESPLSFGQDAVCLYSSRGGCLQSFPQFGGPSATFGVMRRQNRWTEVRLGAGAGALTADGTRVGAAVGQFDASAFPLPHLGFSASVRTTVIPRFRGDRLSATVVGIGVRIR